MAYTLLEISAARQIFIFCRRGMSENFDPVSALGALSLTDKRSFWASTLNRDAPILLERLRAGSTSFWMDANLRGAAAADSFLAGLQAPALLVSPLFNQGVLIGAILFGWSETPVELSALQQRLIATVTHSLELALENARLNEMLSEKLQQTLSIQDITREILRKTDLQDVLQLIAAGALHLVDAVGCTVYIYDEYAQAQVAYQMGRTSGLNPAQFAHLTQGVDMRQRSTPLVLEDLTAENPELEKCALLVLPLPGDQANLGLMEIFQRERPILPKDVAAAAVFADQAAVAIEHARLYRRVQTTAVAEERARMARELHDSISQSLYAIYLSGGAAVKQMNAGQAAAAQASLDIVCNTAQNAIGEMRLLIYELRPPMLEQYGFCEAVTRRVQAVEERSGLQVHLNLPAACSLPKALEEPLYRITQEALNNVIKHAGATQVQLQLTCEPDTIQLEITDNGRGFDPQAVNHGGVGLKTMQERAELLRGTFVIRSAAQQGTTVQVRIPSKNDPHTHR